MAQSLLEFILRSKKQGDAVKDTTGDLKDLEKQAKETSKVGEGLGKAWNVAQGALIAGGVAVIASVPALLEQGNAINKAEKALIGYTGSSAAAEEAIRAVVAATDGTITKFEATQNASRLFAMGLANNTEEAAKLTKMAVTLGAAMGEDATTAFENFSLMLANQSIPRLDTFGISGAAVRDRMVELQTEIEGLDRQTAFMMATMELGTDAMNKLEAGGFQATDSVGRLKTELANMKDGLATTIAEGLMPMIDQGLALKDTIDQQSESVVLNTTSYADYQAQLELLKESHPILFAGTENLTQAQWALQRATAGLSEDTLELAESAAVADQLFANYTQATIETKGALDEAASAADGMTDANNNLAISMTKVTEAMIAKEAIDALTESYQAGTISEEAYSSAAFMVLTVLGGYTNAEASASIALAELQASHEDGESSAWEHYNALLDLADTMRSLPSSHTFTINIKTKGSIPSLPQTKSGRQAGTTGKGARAKQAGGTFSVVGDAGIDVVPVSFMATHGETVTVTPRGLPGPATGSGINLVVNNPQFFGVGGIQQFADVILPYLDNARRNA